ncbi:unnamed protein product [Prorocentrum cordatum]|uniref:Uncharacterized protein n=1 Tax=Prorocentrum cordatum TaxID=2364126 RepID=A0ABN9XX36_9DINO|nr:unnamed protein product [Polarella glacialis]
MGLDIVKKLRGEAERRRKAGAPERAQPKHAPAHGLFVSQSSEVIGHDAMAASRAPGVGLPTVTEGHASAFRVTLARSRARTGAAFWSTGEVEVRDLRLSGAFVGSRPLSNLGKRSGSRALSGEFRGGPDLLEPLLEAKVMTRKPDERRKSRGRRDETMAAGLGRGALVTTVARCLENCLRTRETSESTAPTFARKFPARGRA